MQIECSVASNEDPDAQSGDGHTLPDIIFDGAAVAGTSSGFRPVATRNGAGSFALAQRAERSALGSGRVYTVTCRATDGSGNTGDERSATVVVPRTGGGPKDALGAPAAAPAPSGASGASLVGQRRRPNPRPAFARLTDRLS